MSKKWMLGMTVLILVLVGWVVWTRNKSASPYLFEKAGTADITEYVSESGEIISDGSTPIYSPSQGILKKLYVKNGDAVKVGDKLFETDSSASKEEKEAAKARYLAAKAALDASNATMLKLQATMFTSWDDFLKLSTNSTYENADDSPNYANRNLPEFNISQRKWLAAESDFKNQQGVISKDQAVLNSAYEAYKATQQSIVTAPLQGYISNIAFSEGGSIEAKSALTPYARPILLIKTSENLEAVIKVGQANISKIALGQSVIIRPDAYKDKTFSAKVERIDSIGQNNQGIVTFNVFVSLKPDPLLKSGMTFDADIVTSELKNVLSVPNSAVVLDKGKKAVRILEKNQVKYLPVKVGSKGESRTQILDGVVEGQEIIVSQENVNVQATGFFGL